MPEGAERAMLVITDAEGKQLATYELLTENNSIEINMATYRSGVYFYKLVVDMQELETKRMILIKK